MDPFKSENFINEKNQPRISRKESLEIEETFFKVKSPKFRIENEKMESITRLFKMILICGFIILITRTGYLEIIKGKYYKNIASGNRIRKETTKVPRGVIYSRNEELLVHNIPSFDAVLTPQDFPKEKEDILRISKTLAEVLHISLEDVNKKIDEMNPISTDPVLIRENISEDQALILESKKTDLPGIKVEINAIREYLNTPYPTHIIGYTGKITQEELNNKRDESYLITDIIGKVGIEKFYEKELRGTPGQREVEIDSSGRLKRVLAENPGKAGKNLILSINLDLQKKMQDSLEMMMKQVYSSTGSVIALNPESGEILGMVSLPSFDSNLFSKGISPQDLKKLKENPNNPFINRVISGTYPPGSTIKPLMAVAGLEEGVINSNTRIFCPGLIRIGKWIFPCWEKSGHGSLEVTQAIAFSCDVFFYIIGGGYKDFSGLNMDKIKEYAHLFGLGNTLGVDLPGETSGLVPDKTWKEEIKKEKWYIGDTYHVSIGQGDLLATPLQMASYTATIANGGKLYKPYLVKEIRDSETGGVQFVEPEIMRENFISKHNIDIVKSGMRKAVTIGSASSLDNLPIKVAGKTGTAQFGTEGKTHAWFICFAPYDDPEIVLAVLVEGGGEGYKVAAPVAKEILEWYFKYKK